MSAAIRTIAPDHPDHPLEQHARKLDHSWLRRVREEGGSAVTIIDDKVSPEGRRVILRGQLWRNQNPDFPIWAMLIDLIGQIGPDSRIGKAILKAWSK